MQKALLILLLLGLNSCIPFEFSQSQFTATIVNKSGKSISKITLGAKQYSEKFTDSTFIENTQPEQIINLTLNEKKLNNDDGNFVLNVLFLDGKKLTSSCCYLTNGTILVEKMDFEIRKDSIISTKPNRY